MNEQLKKALKFLFPEYQIIESIKTYGFIAKQGKAVKTNLVARQTQIGMGNTANAQVTPAPVGAGGAAITARSVITNKKMPKASENPVAYSGKTDIKVSNGQVDTKFVAAEEYIAARFIGQQKAVEDLMIAFKRPLVTGAQESGRPKNTFFIIGRESTGRSTLLYCAVEALKQEGLLNYAGTSNLNLALYPTQSEKALFLSDLYKALYANSDIVIFENYENAHADMLSIISSLVTTGNYHLSERYSLQNGNLTQITGTLAQNSVSEILANGKYFGFITKASESKITDAFGTRFMENVFDVIEITPYTTEEIAEVTNKILSDFTHRCRSGLSFDISVTATLADYCAGKFSKVAGFESVSGYINGELYKALSEYKLRAKTQSGKATLDYDRRTDTLELLVCTNGKDVPIQLTAYLPKKRTGNLDEVKAELSEVIGLSKVKDFVLDLENNLNAERLREEFGEKVSAISRHMIFTGNPGTGKTTIARIIAKYFKAIGLLSTGQLREVSRSDLVGQYVGHTAKQTNEVIQSALGGVLFIDEAYSLCRDKHDTFGLEAVDTLVKAVEDYRDELIVILAGYQDELGEFLKNNPGLKSRFPNVIDFEDYTPDEMLQIANVTAKAKGYEILPDSTDGLLRLFEKSQIKGRNDGGNGRLVRNVIERAILEQSKRISKTTPKAELSLLTAADFKFESFEKFDLEQRLQSVIGLTNVKEFVRQQYRLIVANEKRRKAGISVDTTQSLNMIFTGNPGTGKTTIARVIALMFKDMGMLKKGHLVETDRGGLVAEYAGQTAKKTEAVFRDALGGVLFIDEAYALSDNGGGFGKEAIDALVKLIEDYRGEIVVILAGYKKEMSEFLKTNSGLESRFPLVIDFPDYSADELYEIAMKTISEKGFSLTGSAVLVLKEQIAALYKQSNAASGNGRMVRNLVEKIMRNQSARIAAIDEVGRQELTEIITEDIKPEAVKAVGFDLEKRLQSIVGLTEVKNYIRSLEARLRIQGERKKMGLVVDSTQTLHMIFKGNPGTGKTMIARTVADVLSNLGVISTNKLVETDRAGLVAGYVGQTAIKTTEKIMEAMNGVLFIDEAYSLSQGGSNDFGREAIDTLVKLMDDNRDRLVVILAGYSENMDGFLFTNPGLKSRFPNIIEFADYTVDELMHIADGVYSSKGYTLCDAAKIKLEGILRKAASQEAFGNGRYVRNLYERSINKQALRLSTDTDLTREELTTIEAVDIEEV